MNFWGSYTCEWAKVFSYHILLKFNSEVPACLKYVATSKYLQRRKYILIPLLYNCQEMYPEGLIWIRLSWGGTLSVGTSRHSDGGGVTLSHDCNDNAMVPTLLGPRGPLWTPGLFALRDQKYGSTVHRYRSSQDHVRPLIWYIAEERAMSSII